MELSSDGKSKGKRKLVIEEASGSAWGAQSFSANKNNAINKSMKDSGKDPGFGDFGRYFSEKTRKLRDQYHQDATASFLGFDLSNTANLYQRHSGFSWLCHLPLRPVPKFSTNAVCKLWERRAAVCALCSIINWASAEVNSREIPDGTGPPNKLSDTENTVSGDHKKRLFQGVSIFVDGFTTPTHQELRFLMMNHGGVFENYFSSQLVTHIICSTLPDSKIMNIRLMSRGLPIVKPQWIVDSIKENRLLSWENYQLERLAYSDPHQRTLAASFCAWKLDETSDVHTKGAARITQNAMDATKKNLANLNNDMGPPATDTLEEPGRRIVSKPVHLEYARTSEDVAKVEVPVPPLSSVKKPHERALTEPELASGAVEHILPNEDAPDVTVFQKQVKPKPTTGRGHSTLDDPNFVESYFKFSRLHFIGTWRTRYQNLVNAGSFEHPEEGTYALPVPSSSGRPVIIHLDMDCFFVSVVVRNQPALVGKPVAVCHSNSAQGTGEISSANYPARSFGIRAGMFVRDAKARCPDLTIVPYDFQAYEQVADIVYSILHRHCSTVQAVSCDEAFLDVTGHPEPASLASRIREEIFQATRCTASAGIAENLLLSRLATKKAKPNGQYVIQPHEVKKFMATLPVEELPGVGWTLREKLHGNGLYNCADLQSLSKEALQKVYGTKTGIMLWSYAQGIDEREVQPAQERKSIGAEVNWGVRFSSMDDAQQFLVTLSNEVAMRMQKASSSGRTITLKVKRRKEGIGEPVKFMGCGVCDNLSRSETVGYPTNSAEVLLRIGLQLFASLHLDVQEVRGVGLQVSRLVSTNTGTRKQHNALDSWLAPSTKLSTGKEEMNQITDSVRFIPEAQPKEKDLHDDIAGPSSPWEETDADERFKEQEDGEFDGQPLSILDKQPTSNDVQLCDQTTSKSNKNVDTSLELPPFSQIDPGVLECLPPDIVTEIIDAHKAQEEVKNRERMDRKVDVQPKITSSGMQKRPSGGQLHGRTKKGKTSKPRNSSLQLPPQSQLDPSVLQSLPEDILIEINRAYEQELNQQKSSSRSHQLFRPLPNLSGATTPGDTTSLKEKTPINNSHAVDNDGCGSMHNSLKQQSESTSSVSESREEHARSHFGQQPKSMKKTVYEDCHTMLQNIIESRSSGQSFQSLSSGLLSAGSYIPIHDDVNLISDLEQCIKQFFQLIIRHVREIAPKDLEEVHLILLYLKRLGSRCKLWRAVHELTMTAAKDIIGEVYGGQLNI